MYYFLSFIIGCIVAIMIAINGQLTSFFGVYTATFIIHIVGTVFAFFVLLFKRIPISLKNKLPLWLYLGGVIGVLTVVFNNIAFGKISLTAIMALCLLGQSLTSLIIDTFGLFGMQKHKFLKSKLIGLSIVIVGIFSMFQDLNINAYIPIFVSLFSGVTIVLSRSVNAKLSEKLDALQGSFFNHLTGLFTSFLVLLLIGRNEILFSSFSISTRPFIYFGGFLGVSVVLLSNLTTLKISSLHMTLFQFLGQIFTGMIIDSLIQNSFSKESLIGGLFVLTGLFFNLIIENTIKRCKNELN